MLARLAQVQLAWHDLFDKEQYRRAVGSHLVETVRGGIYTRWGTPLATQVPSFDLGVYYSKLNDDDWQGILSSLCGATVEELSAEAEGIVNWVERIEALVRERQERDDIRVAERYQHHCVVEDVPAEVAAAVRAEPGRFPTVRVGRKLVPSVQVLERARREYPNSELAPHIVGLVAPMTREIWDKLVEEDLTWIMGRRFSQIGRRYTMDDRTGISGVEKTCEELLRGARGYVLNQLVFGVLKVEARSQETPPDPGCDVYLTIREDFQRAASAALGRAAATERLKLKSGALVILDVRDGAVLAAATYPSYDLATYRQDFEKLAADPRHPELFRPLQAALPTGSVYKVITAIAALEEGVITPSTTFTCGGSQVFGSRRWDCHSTWGHGTLSLVPAIEHSCNVYFYNLGDRVGGEALARWGRRFGLGTPTGVDLPYERAGRVPVPRYRFGALNLCIGQGDLLCTPLQVANMMAAVANGGRLYRPHFFHHAKNAQGEIVRTHQPEFVEIPVRPSTLDAVREGMRLVVSSGTARRAVLDPFRAAGKTGTAERAGGLNHAWFAGYAPCDEPRIAFAVVSERTSLHGGDVAEIVRFALEEIWDEVEQMP